MTRVLTWLVRPALVRVAWWLTTHEGFYSPCDDTHCIEVRAKARGLAALRTKEGKGWMK